MAFNGGLTLVLEIIMAGMEPLTKQSATRMLKQEEAKGGDEAAQEQQGARPEHDSADGHEDEERCGPGRHISVTPAATVQNNNPCGGHHTRQDLVQYLDTRRLSVDSTP